MKAVLVCGPPGSGKTTFVKRNVLFGDVVIDLDEIIRAISFQPLYTKPANIVPVALGIKKFLIDNIKHYGDVHRLWIVSCSPDAFEREEIAMKFNARIVVFEVSPSECLKRIYNDIRRKDKASLWKPIIEKWWQDYTRGEGEIVTS